MWLEGNEDLTKAMENISHLNEIDKVIRVGIFKGENSLSLYEESSVYFGRMLIHSVKYLVVKRSDSKDEIQLFNHLSSLPLRN